GAAGMVSLLLLQTAAAFGAVPPAGWTLGALCLSYFLTSGLRVRSLVRARKVEGFRRISVAVHGAVLAGAAAAALAGAAPPLAPAAFAPGLVQAVRILGRGPAPVNTLRMGIGEILHAAAFVVLTIATYRLSRTRAPRPGCPDPGPLPNAPACTPGCPPPAPRLRPAPPKPRPPAGPSPAPKPSPRRRRCRPRRRSTPGASPPSPETRAPLAAGPGPSSGCARR